MRTEAQEKKIKLVSITSYDELLHKQSLTLSIYATNIILFSMTQSNIIIHSVQQKFLNNFM